MEAATPSPFLVTVSDGAQVRLLSRRSRPDGGAGVDGFEGAARHLAQRVQLVVVPARVGGARDVPAGAVVRHDHPVLLSRLLKNRPNSCCS